MAQNLIVMAKKRIPSMDEMTAYLGLTIDDEPVASLCAGCKPEEWPFVNRRYLMSRSRGFEVKYGPERVVETIFLNRFGKNGYAQFASKLPKGISFGDPPQRIRGALDKPSSSGVPHRGHGGTPEDGIATIGCATACTSVIPTMAAWN